MLPESVSFEPMSKVESPRSAVTRRREASPSIPSDPATLTSIAPIERPAIPLPATPPMIAAGAARLIRRSSMRPVVLSRRAAPFSEIWRPRTSTVAENVILPAPGRASDA